jgi:hypothetical protein
MLTEKALLQEIEECQTHPITDKKFERLADCFIVYDHLFGQVDRGYSRQAEAEQTTIKTNCGTEFLSAVDGKDADKVWAIIDEMVEVMRALHPRVYDGVLQKLDDI